MNSDDYFDDDFDDEALAQVDAIEAAHFQQPSAAPVTRATSPVSDYGGSSFDFDEDELRNIDKQVEQAIKNPPKQALARTSSRNLMQTTLFGEVLPKEASTSRPRPNAQKSKLMPLEPRKTKYWDHTAFAKSGVKSGKGKGKGKQKQSDDDVEDEEPEEFEQFPAPFISRESAVPCCGAHSDSVSQLGE